MLKNYKTRLFLVAIVIFSMIAIYGFVPAVKAASLTDASITLSDSDLGVAATSTVAFTTGIALSADDKIVISYPVGFADFNVNNVTCPSDATEAVDDGARTVTCTVVTQIDPGAQSMTVGSVTNPGTAGYYTINIATKDDADVEIEAVDVMVYIIEDITMDATVPANLTFSIAGLGSGVDVNGTTTTEVSTATTTPFGTLSTTGIKTVGQELAVSTNADDGFTVTVQQTSNMKTASDADIDSFDNGVVPGAPKPWEGPDNTIDQEATFGHMGVTSEDPTFVADADTFGDNLYDGLDGVTPLAVMYHDGPVNGTGEGLTQVAYSVQIGAMQEAGDYSTTLTYVCTPQF